MSKITIRCSFLGVQIQACMHRHVLACAACIHAYVGLFLHACICSSIYAHSSSDLRTHGARQKPQFGYLDSFFTCSSSVCNFNIIPHHFCNPLHASHHLSLSHHSFHLIMNLISFSFRRFYLHILVEGVPTGHWYGTTSLSRRLEVTFVLRVLSPSSA